MLVAFCFNVGSTGLREFHTFRAALERYDYDEAARQLRKSLWSKQLPDRADEYVAILIANARPRYVLPTPHHVLP